MNSPFSDRRVLLVEDEIFVVWLLEDMLADLGCAVVGPASSVNQALAMIDAEAIDAAVLDVNLNGQMSYPIADALAARGVPFVFSTGYDKDALLDGYRTFPVLQKPIQRSELSDTIAKLLTPKKPSVKSAIVTIALDQISCPRAQVLRSTMFSSPTAGSSRWWRFIRTAASSRWQRNDLVGVAVVHEQSCTALLTLSRSPGDATIKHNKGGSV